MFKKISFLLILTIILSFCSISAFAAGDGTAEKSAAESTVTEDNFTPPPPIFEVTRPTKDEKIYDNKTYLIRFITNYDQVKVRFLRQNQDGKYVELKANDGLSSWEFETPSIYSKEITLNKGENNIKLVATYTYRIKVKKGVDGEPDEYKEEVKEASFQASITFAEITKEKAKSQETKQTKALDNLNPCKK